MESELVQVEVLVEWAAAQEMVFSVHSETQPGLRKLGKNVEQVSQHEKQMVYSLGKDGYAEERAEVAPYDKFQSRPQNMAATCQKAHLKLQNRVVPH